MSVAVPARQFDAGNDVRCPSSAELIAIWESGLGRPNHERALMLLEKACPAVPLEELARWGVGRRDAVLFRLRQALFGDALNSVVQCLQCQSTVELSFSLSELWVAGDYFGAQQKGSIKMAGFHVEYRVPDSDDLDAVSREQSVSAARGRLLERCLLSVEPEQALPVEVSAAVIAGMAELDPGGDRRLNVICEECGFAWEEIFDVAAWLSDELGTWVRRLLREVHSLATAYGWREEDILGMNPTRRQMYLNILAQA